MDSQLQQIASVIAFENVALTEPKSSIDPSSVIAGGEVWERTRVIYADASGELTVGLWESAPGTWRVVTEEDEYVRLLEGGIALTDRHGVRRKFEPGDSFFVPRGFDGTWESVGAVRKIFVSLKRRSEAA